MKGENECLRSDLKEMNVIGVRTIFAIINKIKTKFRLALKKNILKKKANLMKIVHFYDVRFFNTKNSI